MKKILLMIALVLLTSQVFAGCGCVNPDYYRFTFPVENPGTETSDYMFLTTNVLTGLEGPEGRIPSIFAPVMIESKSIEPSKRFNANMASRFNPAITVSETDEGVILDFKGSSKKPTKRETYAIMFSVLETVKDYVHLSDSEGFSVEMLNIPNFSATKKKFFLKDLKSLKDLSKEYSKK